MKKPNPVPDPIIPTELHCKITHYHRGNRTQKELNYFSRVKKCKYITLAELWLKGTENPSSVPPIASAISVCGPSDTPNRKKGTIQAAHAAVRKVYPDFYKELRLKK